MPKYGGDVEMVRVTVRLTKQAVEEVDRYILESGAYRTYFLSLALVVGARKLAAALWPENEDRHSGPRFSSASAPTSEFRREVAELVVKHETLGGLGGPTSAPGGGRGRGVKERALQELLGPLIDGGAGSSLKFDDYLEEAVETLGLAVEEGKFSELDEVIAPIVHTQPESRRDTPPTSIKAMANDTQPDSRRDTPPNKNQ